MWILTKKPYPNTEIYITNFECKPDETILLKHTQSITTIAELLDKGNSIFNGVEWLLYNTGETK